MSTTDHVEHTEQHTEQHVGADHHEHAPHPDIFYIKIAVFLAVLTALETSTYWVDFGPFFLPALLGMMAIKFFTVVLFFMHLKEDAKMFGMLFYMGLGLAIGVYVVMLACFQFFG